MNRRKLKQIQKILKPQRRRRGIWINSALRFDIETGSLFPWQKKLLRIMEDYSKAVYDEHIRLNHNFDFSKLEKHIAGSSILKIILTLLITYK